MNKEFCHKVIVTEEYTDIINLSQESGGTTIFDGVLSEIGGYSAWGKNDDHKLERYKRNSYAEYRDGGEKFEYEDYV